MDIILKYFPYLTELQKKQFDQLQSLYTIWNSKINVISRKDIEHLYLKHILHSLSISKIIDFNPKTKIIDVGTGGGFPGVPLAILFPKSEFVLVDSIEKKTKVVHVISEKIGLKNVRVVHSRVEDVNESFDFVISRAVTSMKTFHKWVSKKISNVQKNSLSNGIIYLKGGDLREELNGIKDVRIYNITDYFKEEFSETKSIVYIKC